MTYSSTLVVYFAVPTDLMLIEHIVLSYRNTKSYPVLITQQ
jgi:hypothetical protein